MIKFKTLLRSATALALFAGVSLPAAAQDTATPDQIVVNGHAAIGDFGLDLTTQDPTVKPGEDFEHYASGSWIKKATIPSDRPLAWAAIEAGWRLNSGVPATTIR